MSVVVLTGFYNVTRLGPLAEVLDGGAALLLAGKFILVIAAITLAGQRDFNQIPRAAALLDAGADPAPALAAITRLDGLVLALAAIIMYLGLALSRARADRGCREVCERRVTAPRRWGGGARPGGARRVRREVAPRADRGGCGGGAAPGRLEPAGGG